MIHDDKSFPARVGDAEAIANVVNDACRRAVVEQSRLGFPAIVWRGGKVVRMSPAEIARRIKIVKPKWVSTVTGSMKDDPVFDEVVRLGKEIRDAEQPPDE
jgi:hypothetical protein